MGLKIVATYDAPGRGPAGLAWDGHYLWLADYREGLIFRMTDTMEVAGQLWCPGNLSGLACDGQFLWQALLDEGLVRKINPATTDFDQTIDLAAHGLLSGVAWDGRSLRVVAQQVGDILTVEPATGAVLAHLKGPVAVGDIDCQGDTLWLSAAEPMTYEPGEGFSWLSEEPAYYLIQMDAATGREIGRHVSDGLYTGLAWAGSNNLWLARAATGTISRAIVTPD